MFGIVAVDTTQFGEAVVCSPFAVGLDHIAQGDGRRHGVVVQVEVDASRRALAWLKQTTSSDKQTMAP